MHPFIHKTLGGLSPQYYFRQFFFGSILAGIIFLTSRQIGHPMPVALLLFAVVNTLLYPYSRFVYEGIVNFFVGKNVFYVNIILMLLTKLITMAICWTFALLVAPIGLTYLYFQNRKTEG